jgi:hypothetical protein
MKKSFGIMVAISALAAIGVSVVAFRPTFPPEASDVLPPALTVVAEDTCPCFLDQPDKIPCNEVKVITFQGQPNCVTATTIYEEFPNNSSGSSDYLALGYLNSFERRIFIRFELEGIVPEECRNPNLGFMAPFDSAQLTLFVVNQEPCEKTCGMDSTPDGRQFFLAAAQRAWNLCDRLNRDSCLIFNEGIPSAGCGSTWRTDATNYWWPFSSQPRNLAFEAPCIDSIVFVCHRPMPFNSPMKRTLREWIIKDSTGTKWENNGWVILPDSTQDKQFPNSALLFYSPTYWNQSLRPRLRLWFTRGVNREDKMPCVTSIDYIVVPTEQKKK